MSAAGNLAAAARVLRLPPRDRRRNIEAAGELMRASLQLRRTPSPKLAGLLGTPHADDPSMAVGVEQLREAARVGRTVARVARRVPSSPTCLPQALAVQRMLRRRGIPSRLHLGVTSPAVGEAHAWVTVAERPVVGGAGIERYVPLAAFR
jgi:Transglutaminase-like superfamily